LRCALFTTFTCGKHCIKGIRTATNRPIGLRHCLSCRGDFHQHFHQDQLQMYRLPPMAYICTLHQLPPHQIRVHCSDACHITNMYTAETPPASCIGILHRLPEMAYICTLQQLPPHQVHVHCSDSPHIKYMYTAATPFNIIYVCCADSPHIRYTCILYRFPPHQTHMYTTAPPHTSETCTL